jgi:siroheme synthase
MAHEEIHDENPTHEEIKYRYHIQRGSDFTKIELYRSARENYKEALKYKPGDPFATGRIAECNAQIRRDTVKVLIIVPIVLAIIAAVVILNV